MKVVYLEKIKNKTAFSRKMYCPSCGGHEYNIVETHAESGYENSEWFIRCSQCGYEGPIAPAKDLAISSWKHL